MTRAWHAVAALRGWLVRLWATLRPARTDRELEEELRLHLDLAVERVRSEGSSNSKAARQAVLEMGGLAQSMEALRDQRSLPWLSDSIQDVRYGLRLFFKHPGFTAAAVMTLSLGIGATSAIFTTLNAVFIRSLPYQDPDRLVYVGVWNSKLDALPLPEGIESFAPSNADFADLQRDTHAFSSLAEFSTVAFNATDGSLATLVGGLRVTADFFPTFGVAAEIGRVLGASDVRDRAPVAVISHRLWQSAFGGDNGVLNRTLMLNGRPTAIVGVMPPSFTYPQSSDMGPDAVARSTDIWVPHSLTPEQMAERDFSNNSGAIGRLRPGLSVEQARAEISALMSQLDRLHSPEWRGWFAVVRPFRDSTLRAARRPLVLLSSAALLVLLIACTNVAHLLLARSSSRTQELSVRAGLGASRGRLVRQMIAESLLLSLGGGALGLALAAVAVRLVPLVDSGDIPRLQETTVDWRVLGFTTTVTGLTAFLFGLLPAITLSRPAVGRPGSHGDARVTARSTTLRQLLVTTQVGLAMALLSGSLLLIRSYVAIQRADRGFSATALTMRFTLDDRYRPPERRKNFVRQVIEGISTLPGIQKVGAVSALPLSHAESLSSFEVEGFANSPTQVVNSRWATGDYFQAMGTRLIEGRFLNDNDVDGRPLVVVVNQAFAKAYLEGASPLGRHVRIPGGSALASWATVVGVVADVRHSNIEEAARPQIYGSLFQGNGFDNFYLAVQSAAEAGDMTFAIRQKVHQLDPALAVADVHLMGDRVSDAIALRRFQTTLVTLFGLLSIALTAVGVAGLMAYSVRQRGTEIGVRLALGARSANVWSLILGEGLKVTLVGALIGTAGSLAMSRLLKSTLFGVLPGDPGVLAVSFVLLILVALIAGYLPLRRALKADPLTSLRCQ
jgi:predicted permease